MNDAVWAVDNWQRPSNSSAGFTTYRLNCVDVDVDVGRREEWKELIYVPTELLTWLQDRQGWIKSRKIQNCLAWISGNFKTVWQGESGELKTVCWFFKYCLLNFLNCFCVANCLIWLKVKKIEAYSSTFCSINALSINKDNPLLPLQSTTPVFVCQMRKSLKLSVRGEF